MVRVCSRCVNRLNVCPKWPLPGTPPESRHNPDDSAFGNVDREHGRRSNGYLDLAHRMGLSPTTLLLMQRDLFDIPMVLEVDGKLLEARNPYCLHQKDTAYPRARVHISGLELLSA
jgi:hypothetical protein